MEKYKCKYCNGKGEVIVSKTNIKKTIIKGCALCNKTGLVDWVINITRNQEVDFPNWIRSITEHGYVRYERNSFVQVTDYK